MRVRLVNLVLFAMIININSFYVSSASYWGDKGKVNHNNKTGIMEITCNKHSQIIEALENLRNVTNIDVKHVTVKNCIHPINSYAKSLQALGINTIGIKGMNLVFNEDLPIAQGNYTKGLNIITLTLKSERIRYIFRNAQDFLDPLSELASLELEDVEIPKIPGTMSLKSLTLSGNAYLSEWGSCESLERLKIVKLKEDHLPIWPQNCTRLTDLSLRSMPLNIHHILEDLMPAAPYLTNLTLTSHLLYLMPNAFLKAAQKLLNIDLSHNNLYDKAFSKFPLMNTVRSFDVSGNLVKGSFLGYLVPQLPALRSIYINSNQNTYVYCDEEMLHKGIEYLMQSNVEQITFKETELSLTCFLKGHFKNLTYLDLSSTPTLQFELMELPTTGANELTIDFYGRSAFSTDFIDIYFKEEDYKELQKRNASLNNGTHYNHLTVLTKYIDCDCKHGWLARGLRDFPNLITMPGMRCNQADGYTILEQPREDMECKKWSEEATHFECVYKQVWGELQVDAKCSKGIVPWRDDVRSLNVSGSGMTKFHPDMPQSVQWVDYRNNRLSSAGQPAVETMFLNGRRVWLGNNEIICDCSNRVLIDGIQEHWAQVMDYEDLTCIGTGQPISSVSTASLCQTGLKASMTMLGILVGLALILAVIIRRYRQEIRVFLYSKGWCLMCLRKEELDDKLYDAFISFAHGDEAFVKEILVPGLENSPEKFRLCIHYRDWQVGGWIPAQIMHSVTQSKRTIIVLSRNFVESTWSALEFRYALANCSVDDLSRVLILILDDVLDQNLNPELQGYLDFNTYVCCDDPWFWEKLRYAMPHRNDKRKRDRQRKEEDSRQEVISMAKLMETNSTLKSANLNSQSVV